MRDGKNFLMVYNAIEIPYEARRQNKDTIFNTYIFDHFLGLHTVSPMLLLLLRV